MRNTALSSGYERWKKTMRGYGNVLGCLTLLVVLGLMFAVWSFFYSAKVKPPPAIAAHLNEYLKACSISEDEAHIATNDQAFIRGKIVVVDITKRKIADVNANSDLNALRANDPQEVGSVICLKEYKYATAEYTNGTTATQDHVDINVFDVKTTLMVGSTTLDGPLPPGSIVNGSEGYSGPVSDDDIVTYILSIKTEALNAPLPSYPPIVLSVRPSEGSGPGDLDIVGSRFIGATAVKFGSLSVKNFTVISDSLINLYSPKGVIQGRTYDVTVTTPFGTSAISSSDQYVFYFLE